MSRHLSIGYMILSAGLWVYMVWLVVSRRKLARHGTRTTGVITAVIRDDSGDSTTYMPQFRYRASDGKEYTVQSKLGAGREHSYTVGQTVKVVFLPDHPQAARIDTLGQLYGEPVVMGIAAALTLVAGLIFLGSLQ